MIVIDIEPVRLPGAFVVRPWFYIVTCPGKRPERTESRWTQESAERAAHKVAGHLASGREFKVRVKYKGAS